MISPKTYFLGRSPFFIAVLNVLETLFYNQMKNKSFFSSITYFLGLFKTLLGVYLQKYTD